MDARSWGRRLKASVPASVSSRVDLRRPTMWEGFGGPMNGQTARLQVVCRLLVSGAFDVVVETGTFRGATTEFLALVSGLPVHSCDTSERFLAFAAHRTARLPRVHLSQCDSPSFLSRLANDGLLAGTPLIYLDAHWEHYLPLRDELEVIAAQAPRAVVLIDDMEVPGDPGYGYDDYGPGQALTAELLDSTAAAGWRRWYPPVSSAHETGGRRGWVLLASPLQEDLLRVVSNAASPSSALTSS